MSLKLEGLLNWNVIQSGMSLKFEFPVNLSALVQELSQDHSYICCMFRIVKEIENERAGVAQLSSEDKDLKSGFEQGP